MSNLDAIFNFQAMQQLHVQKYELGKISVWHFWHNSVTFPWQYFSKCGTLLHHASSHSHTIPGSSNVQLACERRCISGCHLVPPKNDICEPEPGKDFCDVMTFVSPWPIRFNDRMKLECSSQRIPRPVVLRLFELNCDWLRIPTSQKSFSRLGSQTLFFGGTKWQWKYVSVHRLMYSRNNNYLEISTRQCIAS